MKKIFLILIQISWSALVFGQWTQMNDFPSTPTDGAFSFVLDNKGYVGGGLAGNEVFSFDASNGEWTEKAPIPSPGDHLAWAFSFVINGKAYVGGGSFETASDLTDKMYEYDPQMDTWTEKAPYPAGERDGCFSFSVNGKGYVGGGFDGQYMLFDFYEYNPATDQWRSLPDYPGGPVLFAVSFVIDGKAYAGTGAQGTMEIDDIWEFDPTTESWNQVASFPGESRQAAVGYAVGGKGYIAGGMSDYTTIRSDLWEYDPAADNWQKIEDNLPTDQLAWSTAFVLGNDAFIGLGVNLPDFEFSNSFYKYSHVSTGIYQKTPAALEVYPNPASSVLNIKNPQAGLNAQGYMLDATGKTVKKWKPDESEINIEDLAEGIYLLRLIVEGEIFQQKILVQ
ncbi:MAG: kelch repeat-containing protein [Bacteroidia bacterium]